MNRGLGSLLMPIVAVAVLALVVFQTAGALRASGAWSRGARPARSGVIPAEPDPFLPLSNELARPLPPLEGRSLRDPFSLGSAPVAVDPKPVVRKPVVPPAPPKPVLTAIVWDTDPRAIVRWQGRDLTVRAGGLFDVFQVVDITRDHVTLNRGSETIVLQRKPQGD